MSDRPYLFYELTNSLCSKCLRKVEAKVVIQDERVYLHKWCPEHRSEKVLISTDAEYYKLSRQTLKAGQMPLRFNTPIKYGCPFDCGLCPDHEQHSCLTLLEITDQCNLTCPVCYSESSPKRTTHRSMEQIEFMLDCIVRNEAEPDVVQISGGEPTIHPQFFEVLDAAKRRPIRHLMVNTNGIRIAQDEAFAQRLATYMPKFELYLQFDSLRREPLMQLRGADLRNIREKALERLNKLGISTTLVVTVERGVNDDELGAIVDFALQQPCIRGVTFQPVQQAGRLNNYSSATHRLTLSEVRRRILTQTAAFKPEDLIPVPCHPDSLAMGYAMKLAGKVVPLTSLVSPDVLINGGRNTIIYEQDPAVRESIEHNPHLRSQIFKLFSTNHSPASQASTLRELLCCLPQVLAPKSLGYDNLFRILIVQFIDAQTFDLRSIKKTCIHIAHPDGERLIPFDTYNMFYRDALEQTRLGPLRDSAMAVRQATV